MAVNKETIYHYFDLLEATLQSNGLLDRPSLVFNADESGMPLSHHPGKRVGIRGMKRVCTVTSGVKTQVTVLCCISASGCAIPPLVIFQRKSLLKGLTVGEVPGTMYGLNPQSGWMDGEIFKEWFLRHFLVYAPAGRPLLLLVDDHSSHFNPAFIREAANHGVVVFCLPPNTTHVSQPLDSTCFRSLKAFWWEACNDYMCQNPGKVVTLYQFSKLFASAFMKAMTPRNITSSFRVTGVFPPNRKAIPIPGYSEATRSTSTPTAKVASSHGIQYLPFYTPSRPEGQQRDPSPSFSDLPHPFSEVDQTQLQPSFEDEDIPLHPSPFSAGKQIPPFTSDEHKRFQRRFEEGFDIDSDERYNLWLQSFHPSSQVKGRLFSDSSPASTIHSPPGVSPCTQSPELGLISVHSLSAGTLHQVKSKLADFLTVPAPPGARVQPKTPQQARVITSAEYLKGLEEKEQLKKQKVEEKERRKKEREERARMITQVKEKKRKEKGNRERESLKVSIPHSTNMSSTCTVNGLWFINGSTR